MNMQHLARPSRQTGRLAALLLVAVLLTAVAVACGGGGGAKTPTSTATGTRTSTPAASASPKATATSTTPAVTGTATATGSPSAQVCGPAARAATNKAGAPPGVTANEILLGADSILSGSLGAVYATIPQATTAYFNYINDTQGGVCGRKITYKVEDNQDDPAVSLSAVRKLVEQTKVFAMVGSLGDVPHGGSWEFLNQNGVPDLLSSAGSNRFGANPCGQPWEIQMIPSYTIDGTFLGQYISEFQAGKTVAVLWENDSVGVDGFAGVKQGIDSTKNQIVADASYELTDISIDSQIATLAKTNAGVLVTYATPGFVAQAVKGADRLGWHPQLVMPYIDGDDILFQFVSPQLLNGAVATDANKLATDPTDPDVAQFISIQSKYGGPPPTNFTLYAHILGELAVDILGRSCNNLTREGVMEAAESTTNFHSPLMLDGVNISFSPTDHVGYQSSRYLQATVDANGKGHWQYFGPLREFQGQTQ